MAQATAYVNRLPDIYHKLESLRNSNKWYPDAHVGSELT